MGGYFGGTGVASGLNCFFGPAAAAGQTFNLTAGQVTTAHTYRGYMTPAYNGFGFAGVTMGAETGTPKILGLTQAAFYLDTAAASEIGIALYGASGAENFTLSFIDANALSVSMHSTDVAAIPFSGGGGGYSWRFFPPKYGADTAANKFLNGGLYTVTVS